jgi:nucleotide-binding universal stress UspA family protein
VTPQRLSQVKCEGYVFRGDARELLVEESEKLGAALLVMGSRGLGAISR